jgi:NitT/TauT family transport system substrate-binding protein
MAVKVRGAAYTPVLLLALGGLAACVGQAAAPGRLAADSPPLQIAYDFWPGYYPMIIAEAQGYFAEYGVRVEALKPENTDSIIASFAGGGYDGLAVALGDVINITQANPDVQVIFVTDQSDGGDALLVTGDIQTVADLRGKRLGTNLGGFGELFVTTVLQEHGLTFSDVQWVNVDAAEVPEQLRSGALEAAHTWEPYVTEAERAGARTLFSSRDTPGLILDVMAFQGATLRARPVEVRGFVMAWFRAVDFWLANPAEGNALIAQALALPVDSISLQGVELMTLSANQALLEPGASSLYSVAQRYVDFFVQKGALTTSPAVEHFIDASFLP